MLIVYLLDCLAYMCQKLTVLMLDHQDSLITFFDQISFIPGEVAIFIVSAIFSLIKVSVTIREHLIITLRKILYRKGTANRQMAVSGILEMLKNLKMHSLSGLAMSSSQYNSSSTGTSSASILTQVLLIYIYKLLLQNLQCLKSLYKVLFFAGNIRERHSSNKIFLQ